MENWETYDQEIRDAGGIDVMLIGLGWDGHFCSNCPRCTPMDSYTYPIDRKTKNAANPTYPARSTNHFINGTKKSNESETSCNDCYW